jgi:hypothetical protein
VYVNGEWFMCIAVLVDDTRIIKAPIGMVMYLVLVYPSYVTSSLSMKHQVLFGCWCISIVSPALTCKYESISCILAVIVICFVFMDFGFGVVWGFDDVVLALLFVVRDDDDDVGLGNVLLTLN